jgi:hypothetical protein
MDRDKRCPECDAIAEETRTVFIRLITNRVLIDEALAQFLAGLFASEENLARLTELWERSEFADVRQRWLQHKRTADTVEFFNTVSPYQSYFVSEGHADQSSAALQNCFSRSIKSRFPLLCCS